MNLIKTIIVLSTVGWIACAFTKEANTGKSLYSPNYIHPAEIRKSGATNAFDLIKQLRPQWLLGRGTTSMRSSVEQSYPVVYADGALHGDINSLRTISVNHITEIKFLNPRDAVGLSMAHPNGAILIIY